MKIHGLFALLLLVVAGCRSQGPLEVSDRTTAEKIQWDVTDISGANRKRAKVIQANAWYPNDHRKAVEEFLVQGEYVEETIHATGIGYRYHGKNVEELLNLDDGGMTWSGERVGALSRLQYSRNDLVTGKNFDPYGELLVHSLELELIGEGIPWYTHEGYDWKELSFASGEEWAETIAANFRNLGVQLELAEGYAMDKEALKARYEKWQKDYESLFGQIIEEDSFEMPTEEGYLLMFQQVLDGIPSIPYYWMNGWADYNFYLIQPKVSVVITKDGIIEAHGNSLVAEDTSEEKELLPYVEAEAKFCQRMKELDIEGTVVHAGLYYVGKPGKNTDYELVPSWVYALYREYETTFYTAEGKPYEETMEEVIWYVLDAVTGEWIKNQ